MPASPAWLTASQAAGGCRCRPRRSAAGPTRAACPSADPGRPSPLRPRADRRPGPGPHLPALTPPPAPLVWKEPARGPTDHLADRHGRRHLGRVLHGVSHRPVPRPQGRRRPRRPRPLLRTRPPPRPPAPAGLTTHPRHRLKELLVRCSHRLGPATAPPGPSQPPRLGAPHGPRPIPLQAARSVGRWLWPILAVSGFLAVVAHSLRPRRPRPRPLASRPAHRRLGRRRGRPAHHPPALRAATAGPGPGRVRRCGPACPLLTAPASPSTSSRPTTPPAARPGPGPRPAPTSPP